MRFFGNIEKTYKDEKGFLIVCGHASTEALDSQGEIVKREAIEGALNDYMKFANVREMHQPSAVGKAMVANMDDKGLYIEVKVVDTAAAQKCEEGVYSGFSIGGKATGRDPVAKNTITGLRLSEISLVDRPANPEAVFTMFKMDEDAKEGEVEKGMMHVADLALLLKQLSWLIADQNCEAAREGDSSALPARLQDWLKQGGDILVSMTQEETAELAASVVGMEQTADPFAMSEQTEGVEKKGARFAQKTLDALVRIKDTLTQNLNELNSLISPEEQTMIEPEVANLIANPNELAQPEGERGQIGTPLGSMDTSPDHGMIADLSSAAPLPTKSEEPEDLKKSHNEAIEKITSLTSELEAAHTTIDTLTKRVQEFDAQPATPKVKLLSLAKADDVQISDPRSEEIAKLEQSKDPAQIAKAVFMRGGTAGFPK